MNYSQVVLAIRPWDHEQDIPNLILKVMSIDIDGISWGANDIVDIGYGVKELHIAVVLDNDRVQLDTVLDTLSSMDDMVSQVSVSLYNRV